MYFGHKHVEIGPNCSHELATFLKYHMPLNFAWEILMTRIFKKFGKYKWMFNRQNIIIHSRYKECVA